MVDALRNTAAALRRGGTLLDVRPSPRLAPRVLIRGRVIGRCVVGDVEPDLLADRAIERVVDDGLLRRVREWRFWYRFTLATRADLEVWLASTRRFPGYRGRALPARDLTVRRAIEVQELRTR